MEINPRYKPYLMGILMLLVILVLALTIRSCVLPSKTERIVMTATAEQAAAIFETKVAALTAVVAAQTATAMPTPTPSPEFVCLARAEALGLAAVLEPFELAYDEKYDYEACVVEKTESGNFCNERIVLEKGEYGPIIPSADDWIIIPGIEEGACDDGGGRWVLAVPKAQP